MEEQQNNVNEPNQGFEKILDEKKTGNKSGIAIAVIVLLILSGLCIYYFFFRNKEMSAKEFYEHAINKTVEIFNENLKENNTIAVGNFALDIELNSTDDFMKLLNDIDLSIDYQIDLNEKLMLLDLDTKYKKTDLLGASVYLMNDKAYLYSKDLLDKYLLVEDANLEFTTPDNESTKVIINSIATAMKDSFKDTYFVKLEEDKLTNYQMLLEKEGLETFFKDLFAKLEADDEFLEAYAKYAGIEKSEVVETLKDNKEINAEEGKLQINAYVNSKMEVEEIKLIVEDYEEKAELTLKNITEEKFDYEIVYDNTKLDGAIEYSEKDGNYNYTIVVNYKDDEQKFKFTLTGSTKDAITVNKPTVSGAINIEDLTEEDQMQLIQAVYGNSALMEIIELFSSSALIA